MTQINAASYHLGAKRAFICCLFCHLFRPMAITLRLHLIFCLLDNETNGDGGGGGGGRACFTCGSEDHQKRDCPQGGGKFITKVQELTCCW